MTAADMNRARVLALRLLRESGWSGPARVAVELREGALTLHAEPAYTPETDSPATPEREVSHADVQSIKERARRAARKLS
jgi:hypothetical protein